MSLFYIKYGDNSPEIISEFAKFSTDSLINQLLLSINCRGENQKITYVGYPKEAYCYATYSDGGEVCSDGNQCDSGICILSYEDDRALRFSKLTNDSLTGTCLASRQREKVNLPYSGCPMMSINDGKVGEFSLCANN